MYRAPQGPQATGVTGYKGFFYHFLDMDTGLRFQQVELSTIDTSLLLAGALFCQSYFTGRESGRVIHSRLRRLALRARGLAVDSSAQSARQHGMASRERIHQRRLARLQRSADPQRPRARITYPSDRACRAIRRTSSTYRWADFYGQQHVNFAPLFGHQYSHIWIDFRGIRDAYMRDKGIDYFENARRATYSQRAYAIGEPR